MNPDAAKRFRLLASVLSVLALIVGAAGLWYYFRLRASLPQLDGSARLSSLASPVTLERDALGVPTIRGANRPDVARALGWVHAQDRYFQMDVLRRRGAGELAEIFGKGALPLDQSARRHGFRPLAEKILTQLAPAERALLEAYASGVNAGLAALREKPFEYLVLRETPRPWQPADSFLVHYAMTLDLQDGDAVYERSLATLRDQLGDDAVKFFAPLTTPDDAALDGTVGKRAPILPAKILDRRRRTVANPSRPSKALHPGSNSFALAGSHTANGGALLANDMHLDHGVPNTWYRASLEWPEHKITGVTLPGTPFVIVGSNGRIAWGFTNANIDSSDLAVVEVDSISSKFYLVPGQKELKSVETRQETIRIKGSDPVIFPVQSTIWGPVIGTTAEKRLLALRWVAHDAGAANLGLGELENATSIADALAVAHRAGLPAQNFLVADSTGNIAWTIAGRVPKRAGFDGRLPVSWSFGDRRWDGFYPSEEIPVLASNGPSSTSRLWSANQRMVGGAGLTKLGDGGYAFPFRATRIRDRLATLEKATPKDLLAIQLDERATFLDRWQKLLLATLTPEAVAQKKSRGELRALVEKWEGRATTDSISYRLVRSYREWVAARVLGPLFESCTDAYAGFDWGQFNYEDALWSIVEEKPAHLFHPAWLVAAADDVVEEISDQHVPLGRATWGRHNRLRARHPFSHSLPAFLTGWLNLPADPLPGDTDLPRVQNPGHGASERLVVSPGREAEGIFHMPGGQSGHPLSPYFRAGHEAWVRGEPTPFLPGKTVHTLTLSP